MGVCREGLGCCDFLGYAIKFAGRALRQEWGAFREVLALWISVGFVIIAVVVVYLRDWRSFALRGNSPPLKKGRT